MSNFNDRHAFERDLLASFRANLSTMLNKARSEYGKSHLTQYHIEIDVYSALVKSIDEMIARLPKPGAEQS